MCRVAASVLLKVAPICHPACPCTRINVIFPLIPRESVASRREASDPRVHLCSSPTSVCVRMGECMPAWCAGELSCLEGRLMAECCCCPESRHSDRRSHKINCFLVRTGTSRLFLGQGLPPGISRHVLNMEKKKRLGGKNAENKNSQ